MKIQPASPTPLPNTPEQSEPATSTFLQVHAGSMNADNNFQPIDLSRPGRANGVAPTQHAPVSASIPQVQLQAPICVFMGPGNYNITYRSFGGAADRFNNARHHNASNPDRPFGKQGGGGKGGDRYFQKKQ